MYRLVPQFPVQLQVGREHFLSCDRAPLAAAATWIERQHNPWTSRLGELEALLEAERA